MPKLVSTERNGAVAAITVCRPEALNALNADVLQQLYDEIVASSQASDVRVLMLTGAGDRAFIAGADIAEFVGASPIDALAIAARMKRVTDALQTCPKPVVAVVNGYCLGGGLELALACDIRIASLSALFGLPEIKLGIIPGGGGTVRLTKIAGSSIARMMAMTGDPIPAARALDFGLVASVHEPEMLTDAAQKLAQKLAALSPFALGQLKSTLNLVVDAPSEAALGAEIKSFALCYATKDQKEGAKAFIEKRAPIFTGE